MLYAIGDIHGQLELLERAHARIARDGGPDARIIHVGDLIDRGPDSRGVIEYLIRGQEAGRDWHVVKGNHDRFLPEYLHDPEWCDPNLSRPVPWDTHSGLGADATLRSYGVDPELPRPERHRAARKAVPQEHAAWLAGLPLWRLDAGALFVHAGIRPHVDLWAQSEDDLLWIRADFLSSGADHGALIVHGHSPLRRATFYGNRLNIDSGAAFGGPLSAVRLDAKGAWLLEEDGPVLLSPEGCP